ncbi:type II toxin-antitoxin system VapC family toxin [Roseomonas sp. PWR1]|uniref:Type II toxin-antitoxin system VapC family toxin n=1 Tax=Roseomonas nitratireducens TaxID=2820810 RepID=A0ABS4AZN8_9PROT|nr:type II toxin-antitoxin system VapC family toxin [Neoroseomonas nitratireducens]
MSAVLLDTCAVLWLAQGEAMGEAGRAAIRAAAKGDGAYVSAATAWEIGQLCRPRGQRPPLVLLPDPETWIARVFAAPGLREAPLTREIMWRASALPGGFHADPADRFIVATAQTMGVPVVTRDRAILAYAAEGFVGAVGC